VPPITVSLMPFAIDLSSSWIAFWFACRAGLS
jgi:hypothetical protein